MAISQESLLGMLIPDVYIDGVTLESSGTPAIEDNPHILHDREAQSVQDYKDAMENRTLRVSVDLCLKEQLDNTLIGSWFREQEFHKYLKLQVFQTTHTGLISVFSHSQNMINLATTGLDEGHWTDEEVERIVDACGSYENAEQVINNPDKFQSAHLSVSADVIGDNSDLTQVSSSVDENGTSIHDFTYRAVFELSVLQPKDLGIFAVSYLDLGAMKDDYDLEFDIGTLEQQNGKVVSEIVIKRGKVVSTSNVWTTPSGEYWTGPVHKTGLNSWATGSSSTNSSLKLTKRTIPNDVVQDFRDVAEIMKYSLDADIQESMSALEKNKFCGKDRPFIDHKYLYFSDIWLSRDTDGTARFMFAFDKKSFLQKNSVYGWLLERLGESTRASILNAATVRNMTILRRRVKNVDSLNKLGSPYTGEILFDKNEPYVSLVMTANNRNNKLAERNGGAGSIRESNLLITPGNDDVGIQYYTGQDKTMKFKTDGIYQYGVRIDMEDGIQEFLRAITSDLLTIREELQLYLDYSMRLGMTKYLQEIVDPHLDHGHERLASVLETSGHYDPIKNRFTSRFYEFMEEQYGNPSAPFYQNRPWVTAPARYTDALALISQNAESDLITGNNNIANKISKLMSPTSGTPQGIMAVMDLFDVLISKYQMLTGDDYRNRGRGSMTPNPTNPAGASVASGENIPGVILKCENWFFNNLFDSNVGKKTGFDYLTNMSPIDTGFGQGQSAMAQLMGRAEYADVVFGNNQQRGLKLVDGGYWTQRVQAETTKYFDEENASTDLTFDNVTISKGSTLSGVSHAFLSPSVIVAGDNAYSTHTDADPDYYITLESALLSASENLFPVVPDESSGTNQSAQQKSYQSSMANIWSKYNLTIMPSTQAMPVPFWEAEQPEPELTACENQQLQAVDPFPAWNLDEEGNIVAIGNYETEEPVGSINSDYTDFFAKLSDALVKTDSLPGSMGQVGTGVSTGSSLDLTVKGNIFDRIATDSLLASAITTANGSSGTTVKDVYDSMPNQLKSVVLDNVGDGIVSTSADEESWVEEPKFNINYQFLAMVERFDGFERTVPAYLDSSVTVGSLPTIKRPRWVPMSADYFVNAAGEEIMCRLSEYTCEELGIKRPDGIAAPIYDAYFIITPFVRSPANPLNDTIIIIANSLEETYQQSNPGARQYGSTNSIPF